MPPKSTAPDSDKDGVIPAAPWWHTAFLLLAIFAFSAISARQRGFPHVPIPGLDQKISSYVTVLANEWATALLIWLWLKRHHLTLGGLVGGRWQSPAAFFKDLGLAVGFLVVAIPILAEVAKLTHAATDPTSYLPRTPLELILWLLLAASGGFCEELVYRGYLIHQFRAWTRSQVSAVLLQGVVFGLAHGYQGKVMMVIMVHGWFLGLFATWRKSLRPAILAHSLQDALGGMAGFFGK